MKLPGRERVRDQAPRICTSGSCGRRSACLSCLRLLLERQARVTHGDPMQQRKETRSQQVACPQPCSTWISSEYEDQLEKKERQMETVCCKCLGLLLPLPIFTLQQVPLLHPRSCLPRAHSMDPQPCGDITGGHLSFLECRPITRHKILLTSTGACNVQMPKSRKIKK